MAVAPNSAKLMFWRMFKTSGRITLPIPSCFGHANPHRVQRSYPVSSIYVESTIHKTEIGNITRTLSPIQPVIFPLTYQSISDTFNTGNSSVVSATQFSGIVDQSMVALGAIISEAQTRPSQSSSWIGLYLRDKIFQLTGEWTELEISAVIRGDDSRYRRVPGT